MACAIITHIFLNFQKSFIEKTDKGEKTKKQKRKDHVPSTPHELSLDAISEGNPNKICFIFSKFCS